MFGYVRPVLNELTQDQNRRIKALIAGFVIPWGNVMVGWQGLH